jgi:hypothetical protein
MSPPVGQLHRTISAFLSDHPSVATHRPRARAAFWTLPSGGLGVAATAAWMRLTGSDAADYGVVGADVLDAEAIARVNTALRTHERLCVTHGVAGAPTRWFEVSTWPLTSPAGDVVATAATLTEVPESRRRPARSGHAGDRDAPVAVSLLATPGAPRIATYTGRGARR